FGQSFIEFGQSFIEFGQSFIEFGQSFIEFGQSFIEFGQSFIEFGQPPRIYIKLLNKFVINKSFHTELCGCQVTQILSILVLYSSG
ncbi:MAG: hypothetical protein V7L25_35075, partial [Nostoc sp.]|uniref:hypothetical protein n=1 Tax=Nostoc sp. TaxID=1180 RepID=UPI002FEF2715